MTYILTTEAPAAIEIMKAIEHHPHHDGMLAFVLHQTMIVQHPHVRTLWLPLSEESPYASRIRAIWRRLEREYPERATLILYFANEPELQEAA